MVLYPLQDLAFAVSVILLCKGASITNGKDSFIPLCAQIHRIWNQRSGVPIEHLSNAKKKDQDMESKVRFCIA